MINESLEWKTDLETPSLLDCIEVTWLPVCQVATNDNLIHCELSVQWTGVDNSEMLCAEMDTCDLVQQYDF